MNETVTNRSAINRALLALCIGAALTMMTCRAETTRKPAPAEKTPADKTPADKTPADKTPADEDARVAADFFLMPAPFGEKEKQDVMLDYLAAPLMDLDTINELSRKFEEASRARIVERQREIARRVCALPAERRSRRIALYEEAERHGLKLWMGALERHDRARIRKIKIELKKEFVRLDENYLKKILAMRALVKKLQEERQRLVSRAWRDLFAKLKANPPEKLCQGDRSALAAMLPREILNAPLYLARYRFLAALPPSCRMRLIVQ